MVMLQRVYRDGRPVNRRVNSETLRNEIVAEMKSGRVNILKTYEAMGPENFEEYLWMLRRNDNLSAVAEALGPDFFPNISLDAAHKAVIRGYEGTPQDWRRVCKAGTAADFKPQNRIAGSELPDFPQVSKGASYRAVTISDEKANYTVARRGYLFELDFETRANDDLGMLGDFGTKVGRAYGRTLDRFFFTTNLEGNPTVYDAAALFAAGHNNTVTSAATLNVNNVELGIEKMMAQKGRETFQVQETATGAAELYLRPRWLLVPVSLAAEATRVLATMQLSLGGIVTGVTLPGEANENAFVRGTLRGMIATPYLTTAAVYYLMCDPGEADTFEFGFHRGQQEPTVTQEPEDSTHSFETDASRMKARGIFGGAWLDFRTVVKLSA